MYQLTNGLQKKVRALCNLEIKTGKFTSCFCQKKSKLLREELAKIKQMLVEERKFVFFIQAFPNPESLYVQRTKPFLLKNSGKFEKEC